MLCLFLSFCIVETSDGVSRPGVQWGGNAWERRSHTYVKFCFEISSKLFLNGFFWVCSHTFFVSTTSLLETCLETHFCEFRSGSWRFQVSSRSRRPQVSGFWILQRNGKVKCLQFDDCLLYFQVRNNQNRSEKCQEFEKNQPRSDDEFF